MRKCKITKQEIARLYTEALLTMEEISKIAGVSRQQILNHIKALDIEYRGGRVERVCEYCGEKFSPRRRSVKQGEGKYCSVSCFHASRITNPDVYLIISEADRRRGNQTARKIMKVHRNDSKVIHHIDGDPTNNDPSNLMIYPSHAEHMKAVHHKR